MPNSSKPPPTPSTSVTLSAWNGSAKHSTRRPPTLNGTPMLWQLSQSSGPKSPPSSPSPRPDLRPSPEGYRTALGLYFFLSGYSTAVSDERLIQLQHRLFFIRKGERDDE